jgi:hypothetical protein
MISAAVVKLATEYLDQCAAQNQKATLVGMHWHIDALNKTLPSLEEVNEALAKRPSVFAQRANGEVVFTSVGSTRFVTNDDMKQADTQYRKEFAAALKRLGE